MPRGSHLYNKRGDTEGRFSEETGVNRQTLNERNSETQVNRWLGNQIDDVRRRVFESINPNSSLISEAYTNRQEVKWQNRRGLSGTGRNSYEGERKKKNATQGQGIVRPNDSGQGTGANLGGSYVKNRRNTENFGRNIGETSFAKQDLDNPNITQGSTHANPNLSNPSIIPSTTHANPNLSNPSIIPSTTHTNPNLSNPNTTTGNRFQSSLDSVFKKRNKH